MLRDLYFIVVKDFINKQLGGYDDLLPIQTYSIVENNMKIFLLIFKKEDSNYEVKAEIGIETYRAKVHHEIKLSGETTEVSLEPTRNYSDIAILEAFKNFYFLIALDKVQRLTTHDYGDAELESVAINE